MADLRPRQIADLIAPYRVEPGRKVRLPRDFPTDAPGKFGRGDARNAKAVLEGGVELLTEYQDRLAAQDTYGVLVILQAIDAAGKDGTIRHVMSGVNPQGVEVHSFKIPSDEDQDHDYLWRYSSQLPGRGSIGIFNRSYYEEVLVVRVHPELLQFEKLPARSRRGDIWRRRFREINDWERYLSDQGFKIVKLFLHLSEDEQRRRFLDRIDQPQKNWKFSAADVKERAFWGGYQKAFSEVLSNTSTEWAPWYVIPADDKPFARMVASAAIAHALVEVNPQYPKVTPEERAALAEARAQLTEQAHAAQAGAGTVDPAVESAAEVGAQTESDPQANSQRRTKAKGKKKGKR
jgi:PPK2 family polyphosphate:nucleotide phosphotransferase